MIYVFLIFFILITGSHVGTCDYINSNHKYPFKVRYYPKNTVFLKSDLIDQGCEVFLKNCPIGYKLNKACGRHYDGHFKTFNTYCDLEYENCNSWRQWSMIKNSVC